MDCSIPAVDHLSYCETPIVQIPVTAPGLGELAVVMWP